MNTKWTSAL